MVLLKGRAKFESQFRFLVLFVFLLHAMGRGKGKARVRRGKRKRVPKFVTRDKMLSHREGRVFVHMLGLKSRKEWREWLKSGQRPLIIPSAPDKVYKGNGWVSYADWLGYERNEMLDFAAARAVARQCNLKGQKEWKEFCKSGQRPSNIPSHPYEVYKGKGWVSWPDWLGYERKKGGGFLPFAAARAVARQCKLKSKKKW